MTVARNLTWNENSMITNFIDNLRIGTSCTFNTSDIKLVNKMQQDLDFSRLVTICYTGRQWSLPKRCDWKGMVGD